MIRIFTYVNKAGKKSTKAVAVVGKTADRFCGISLGKVMYSHEYDINAVLTDYAGFKELDHMPKKGEGFPQYNKAFKMFLNSGIQSAIGQLSCTKANVEAIKLMVSAIKTLDNVSEDDKAPVVKEASKEEKAVVTEPKRAATPIENTDDAGYTAALNGMLGVQESKQPIKESEMTGEDYVMEGKLFNVALENMFNNWLDSELSSDDYEQAFDEGYEDRPITTQDELGIGYNHEYEYYEIAYDTGKKAQKFKGDALGFQTYLNNDELDPREDMFAVDKIQDEYYENGPYGTVKELADYYKEQYPNADSVPDEYIAYYLGVDENDKHVSYADYCMAAGTYEE